MKSRQYKKLCKKAAQAIGFKNCDTEDGIWQVWWDCSGMDFTEYDCEDAWPFLVGQFDGAVNTMLDENSECGISWKPDNQCLSSTPKNVFSWARAQNQFNKLF